MGFAAALSTSAAKKLKQQVERIIDEEVEGKDRASVIVQVATSQEARKDEVIRTASEVIRRRSLTLNPRDLLPLPFNELKGVQPKLGRAAVAQRRLLEAAEASLSAQLAQLPQMTHERLRSLGNQALDSLAKSDVVQTAASEVPKELRPIKLWTSKSMVLSMKKDELWRLSEAVPQIRDIRLNRLLRLPPLVEVKNVPPAVADSKVSSWGVKAINALATWGAYGARGQGIKIAILDTGVDHTHPDLKGKVSAWAEFDENGKKVPNSQPHDSDQHGTHCAGILVGGNSSGQWIGVAPEAKLAAALVLNGRHGGTDAQVLAGLEWAIEQEVDVISMSLGGLTFDPETPPTYTEVILTALQAGIPVVTAIGNEGSQTTGSPGNDLFSFAVGATDHRDWIAGFSGGRTHIIRKSDFLPPEALPLPYVKPDISAPGVAIKSSIPSDQWATFNGTSMATPHVAGAVALLLSATSIRSGVQDHKRGFLIQDLLASTVEELGESGKNQRFGFGRLDVIRAIGYAKELGYA